MDRLSTSDAEDVRFLIGSPLINCHGDKFSNERTGNIVLFHKNKQVWQSGTIIQDPDESDQHLKALKRAVRLRVDVNF